MTHLSPAFLGGSTAPPAGAVLATMLAALLINVRVILYCLDDLNRRMIVTCGDRRMWTAVIIIGGPLGQAAYWLYGRGPY